MALATRITISATDKATPSIRNVANAAQGLCDKLESMSKRISGVTGLLGLGAGGLAIGSAGKDILLAASRYDMLGAAMERAGGNAGYSAKEMHEAEAQLVKNGIALDKSRETVTRLAAANVDLSKSAELARTAQNLAVVANIDSSESFERLVHGITSGQTEVLRTLGLSVNFQHHYVKAAQAMGKTANALTEEEKMQIRVNVALEAGAGYAGLYESSMTKAGKQLTSFSRHISNLKTLAGHVGLDALSSGIFGVNDSLEGLNERLMEMKDSGELGEISKSVGSFFGAVTENTDNAAMALGVWYAASKVANAEGVKRIATLSKEHGVMATMKAELAGTTTQLGQDTAAVTANAQALIANSQARLALIDRGISAKQSVVTTLNAPKYAADLDAIKHRKVLERELKTLQGERVIVTRQLTNATNALNVATGKNNIALRAMNGLKSGVSSLITAMGGPWVLGITAATAAIYGIATADSRVLSTRA